MTAVILVYKSCPSQTQGSASEVSSGMCTCDCSRGFFGICGVYLWISLSEWITSLFSDRDMMKCVYITYLRKSKSSDYNICYIQKNHN